MKPRIFIVSVLIAVNGLVCAGLAEQKAHAVRWKHLSTTKGDLSAPNAGKQQTSSLVLDIDKDGINDFVITERTKAPSVLWYRRSSNGWTRYVVENRPLHIEAGGDFHDVDADGHLDIVFAGDWQRELSHYSGLKRHRPSRVQDRRPGWRW